MKITFIEPKPAVNLYAFLIKLPLLGPLYLGTMLKKAGHDVAIINEGIVRAYNDKTDEFHPSVRDADIIGITAVTHSANRAYLIADAVKRRYPDKRIIMGGSHPSALPEEALLHADRVVVGEAENVVHDVFSGGVKDRIVRGTRAEINDLPPVDLDLLAGCWGKKGGLRMRLGPIMASRGCPHNCTFCSVTGMFGRRYRIRDADLVMEEVLMRHGEGFKHLVFYDDNFAAVPEKSKILLEKIIKADIDLTWTSQFSIHVAKDRELVDLLKRAKCTRMLIGVESINPEALKEYHKSQTVKKIRESLRTLVDAGLPVHGMFILGADSDTKDTMKKTIAFSMESGCSTAHFTILTPLPGTMLYDKMKKENRLLIDDWDYYDATHSVMLPGKLSPLALQKTFFHAYKKFYGRRLLYWVLSYVWLAIWKARYKKYMHYLRSISRSLKEVRIHWEAFDKVKRFILEKGRPAVDLSLRKEKTIKEISGT